MKALVVGRSGVRIASVPAPIAQRGHVLVQVAFSFISSGTEANNVTTAGLSLAQRARQQPELVQQLVDRVRQGGLQSAVQTVRSKLEAELPLGYSCSGTVIDVGPGVTQFTVGQSVACGGAGWASHGEVASVPVNLVVAVPQGCDLRQASSVSIGAIALQGVRRADLAIGETAVVIGLGLLGQLTVQLAAAAGCRVVGIDPDARRAELATRLGAHRSITATGSEALAAVTEATAGFGADATIITAAGSGDDIVQMAMEATRRKGKVVIVGDVGLGLKRSPMYEKELDVLISCSYGPGRYDAHYEEDGEDYPYGYVRWTEGRNMGGYLQLLADGRVSVDPLIEGEYALDDGAQAYERLRTATERPLGLVFRYARPTEGGPPAATALPTASRPAASTGQLGVAVVGTGEYATRVLLPNIAELQERFSLRAVVARTGLHAQAAADRFSAGYATTSFDDVLADPTIDAVVICTRHDLHAGQVVQALQAGKHVFCEKPLAIDEQQLASILDAYRAAARNDGSDPPVLTVGFNRRFSPAGRQLQSALAASPQPIFMTYRVNAGRLPRDHWIYGPEGGGRVVGEACHMLDFMLFLAGSEATEISGTSAAPNSAIRRPDDNFTLTVRFDNGSLAFLNYTSDGHPGMGKERIECVQGGRSYAIDDFKRLTSYGSKSPQWRSKAEDKGHRSCLGAFAESVRSGTLPIPVDQLEVATRLSFLGDGLLRSAG